VRCGVQCRQCGKTATREKIKELTGNPQSRFFATN